MKQRNPITALRHMLDYAKKSQGMALGKSIGELTNDEMLQLALVRAVEVIGEAAHRVPINIQSQYPNIPWSQIISTRNRLIHGYDQIDLEILWRTIQEDIPELIAQLQLALDGK